jgi:DNA-binding HxlR family transcriptional regulator
MKKIEEQAGCVGKTLEIIGDKWTPLILKSIADGNCRFGTLQKEVAGISPRTLSQRLDHLVCAGILSKKSYNEIPPRVEYSLTDKGYDLIPILRQMAKWGLKYQAA